MLLRFQRPAVSFNVSQGKREQKAQLANPVLSTHWRIKHFFLGNFAVFDSTSGTLLGSIKREWLSSVFTKDTWEIYNPTNQLIGKIEEKSAGRALARKYMPGGGLVPEQMTLELNGVAVAEINQSFKIIGDIWEMNCHSVPPDFDRRVLLGTMLLMGLIERRHK